MPERKYYSDINETVFVDKLSNGLPVYIIKKDGFRNKYAVFGTKYGSINLSFKYGDEQTDTVAGIAHFLEHKMFDMPNGENALQVLTSNGAQPNAFTSNSCTCYYFECTDNFEENLRMLLRFVSTPYFTEETVQKEQGIIGQEIRMNDDSPDAQLYYSFLSLLYGDHPVSKKIAGTCESIKEIDADTLYKCHSVFYNPSNMVLCVEGDIDPGTVISICNEVLPAEEKPAADSVMVEDKYIIAERKTEKKMPVSAPQFYIGGKFKPFPGGRDLLKQRLVSQLVLKIVAGSTSPFFIKNYESGLLCYDFGAESAFISNLAFWMVGGESKDPDKVFELLNEEINRLKKEGIDEELFIRSKKAMFGSELRSFEDFEDVCLSFADGAFGKYDYMDTIEVINSVTLQDCMQFMNEYINSEETVMSVVLPA